MATWPASLADGAISDHVIRLKKIFVLLFFESLSEYVLEHIRFHSLVMTFAVIRTLVLMRPQNCSIRGGKVNVVALITVHFGSPNLKDLWLNLFLFFRNLIYAVLWKTFGIARACSALTKTCLTWFLYGGISTKSGLRGTVFYSQRRRHLLTPNWKTLLRFGSFSLFVFVVAILWSVF